MPGVMGIQPHVFCVNEEADSGSAEPVRAFSLCAREPYRPLYEGVRACLEADEEENAALCGRMVSGMWPEPGLLRNCGRQ